MRAETDLHSNVKHVHVIGRRGPTQAAFATAELRELFTLFDVYAYADEMQLNEASQQETAQRAIGRKFTVLKQARLLQPGALPDHDKRSLIFHFLKAPISFTGEQSLTQLNLARTELQGAAGEQRAITAAQLPPLAVQAAFRSIGYSGVRVDGVPFDSAAGVVPNVKGLVSEQEQERSDRDRSELAPMFVSGWLKRGPSGVIGDNKYDAQETVATMIKHETDRATRGWDAVESLLRSRGVRFTSLAEWRKISALEAEQGRKFTTFDEIMRALNS